MKRIGFKEYWNYANYCINDDEYGDINFMIYGSDVNTICLSEQGFEVAKCMLWKSCFRKQFDELTDDMLRSAISMIEECGEKHRKCDCREDMEAFLLYAFAKNIYNDLDLDESDTEERKMFMNDICARMFSGLRGKYIDGSYDCPFNPLTDNLQLSCTHNAMWFTESVKPYLFPMSSMTEEQEREFFDTCNGMCEYYWTAETFDWLNANHFDYRGLIPKGLAIDATGLGIY